MGIRLKDKAIVAQLILINEKRLSPLGIEALHIYTLLASFGHV